MLEFTADEIARLLQQHRKELLTFLYRRVSCPEASDDILQDLFVRLLNARLKNPVTHPKAFLYRAAANLATDYLRRRERQDVRRVDEEVLGTVSDAMPGPDAVLLSAQKVERLKRAVAQLPPRRREVFILCKFEQLTYLEAAKRLGVSESSVVKHMVKALDYLRKRVMDDSL